MDDRKKKDMRGGKLVVVKQKGANQDHGARQAQRHLAREPVAIRICSMGSHRNPKLMKFITGHCFLNFKVYFNYLALLFKCRI